MKEYQELAPDEETFRRVWKRVMPDENLSQIVVHSPKENNGKGPTPEPALPSPQPPASGGDEQRLRQVLETLDEGLMGAGGILRRQPGAYPLWDSLRRSAAQAQAAWFLLTGARWPARRQRAGNRERPGAVLRRQYVWEIQFSQLCREMGRAMEAEDIREIFPDMEEETRRRRAMIRNLLVST